MAITQVGYESTQPAQQRAAAESSGAEAGAAPRGAPGRRFAFAPFLGTSTALASGVLEFRSK